MYLLLLASLLVVMQRVPGMTIPCAVGLLVLTLIITSGLCGAGTGHRADDGGPRRVQSRAASTRCSSRAPQRWARCCRSFGSPVVLLAEQLIRAGHAPRAQQRRALRRHEPVASMRPHGWMSVAAMTSIVVAGACQQSDTTPAPTPQAKIASVAPAAEPTPVKAAPPVESTPRPQTASPVPWGSLRPSCSRSAG